MHTPNRLQPYTTNLSESYTRIGRALAGGHPESIVKAVLSHPDLQQITVTKVTDMLNAECSNLCKKDTATPSPFRKMTFDEMRQFNWNLLIKDLEAKAPVLFKMFYTVVSHSDRRNQQKREATHHPAICTAVATLLKDRNREMGGLQTIVSLLLFKSCVKKQV